MRLQLELNVVTQQEKGFFFVVRHSILTNQTSCLSQPGLCVCASVFGFSFIKSLRRCEIQQRKNSWVFSAKQFARSGLDTCLLFCAGLTRSKNVSGWQNEGECWEVSFCLSHSSHLSVKHEQSSLGMLSFFFSFWTWTLIFCIQSKTITSKWFWCTALCFLAFTPLFPALCCCFKPTFAECCV